MYFINLKHRMWAAASDLLVILFLLVFEAGQVDADRVHVQVIEAELLQPQTFQKIPAASTRSRRNVTHLVLPDRL